MGLKPAKDTALVLMGGGARAAYQVGVLKAISEWFPHNGGMPFDIICGTSAGAINGTALACYASNFRLGVKKVEWVWSHFRTSQVYHTDARSILTQMIHNLCPEHRAKSVDRSVAIFDNAPLRELLSRLMDLSRIDRNIERGFLRAVSVSASSYTTGNSVCFFQAEPEIEDWYRVKRRGIRQQLGLEHLLASSSLPMVFPASRIGKRYYGDGSIHQQAPLSPAVHMGGQRILVIGTSSMPGPAPDSVQPPPSAADIAGHLLDTVFTDSLRSDLERLQRINKTLSVLSKGARRKVNLHPIQTHVINPRMNLTTLAAPHYQELPLNVRALLRLIGVNKHSQSDLLSYLLFEKTYCKELIALGYRDAQEQKTAILQFLCEK